jgi:hypothetical protein
MSATKEPKLPQVFQNIFNSIPGIPKPYEQICRLCGKPLTAECNNGACDK